jgi:hypothetical protein
LTTWALRTTLCWTHLVLAKHSTPIRRTSSHQWAPILITSSARTIGHLGMLCFHKMRKNCDHHSAILCFNNNDISSSWILRDLFQPRNGPAPSWHFVQLTMSRQKIELPTID